MRPASEKSGRQSECRRYDKPLLNVGHTTTVIVAIRTVVGVRCGAANIIAGSFVLVFRHPMYRLEDVIAPSETERREMSQIRDNAVLKLGRSRHEAHWYII